jgi:hypothetical protein
MLKKVNMEYIDQDMSLRLVEIFYDMTWAFFISSNADSVAKRMDRHRSSSSSASVSSVNTESASVLNRSIVEKIEMLTTNLKKIRRLVAEPELTEICEVSLAKNDDLYPGFKDVLSIAKDLLSDRLGVEDLEALTVISVFQCIYYRFCDFLIYNKQTGRQMMKMIVTPTRTSQAVYDICRQKFCHALFEEETIIKDGLSDLAATMLSSKPSTVSPPPPPSSPQTPPLRPKTPLTIADSPPAPKSVAAAEEAPPSPTFSMVSKTLHKRAPFAAAFPKKAERGDDGVRFPLIEMSDDSDDSDVSSLEEDI